MKDADVGRVRPVGTQSLWEGLGMRRGRVGASAAGARACGARQRRQNTRRRDIFLPSRKLCPRTVTDADLKAHTRTIRTPTPSHISATGSNSNAYSSTNYTRTSTTAPAVYRTSAWGRDLRRGDGGLTRKGRVRELKSLRVLQSFRRWKAQE